MTDTSTEAPTPVAPRRRPLLVGAAAALLAVVVIVAAITASDDSNDGGDSPSGTDVASGPTNPDPSSNPITPGGPSSGSCVERYDLQVLDNRELAFDGTVEAVEGDRVTFAVTRWYRGGTTADVTLSGAQALSGLNSAGPAATLQPGSRFLVAGDGEFAWSCGFTQPYDPALAKQWAEALG